MSYEFKREPLTDSETDRMVNACQSVEEKLIVYGLLDSGMREAELVNMKKDNIQWQRGNIIVWGKGNKRRTVPMSQRVKLLLENHFAFNNEMNLSLSKVYRTVKNVAERGDIAKKVSPHVLRHTFAMSSLQKGVSIVALQKILGHASIQTTMIYLNMSSESALEEFSRKIGGKE